jgi:uncharacterized protein Smg (DUF494 family)
MEYIAEQLKTLSVEQKEIVMAEIMRLLREQLMVEGE